MVAIVDGIYMWEAGRVDEVSGSCRSEYHAKFIELVILVSKCTQL
jgi:hypothetical protein